MKGKYERTAVKSCGSVPDESIIVGDNQEN